MIRKIALKVLVATMAVLGVGAAASPALASAATDPDMMYNGVCRTADCMLYN